VTGTGNASSNDNARTTVRFSTASAGAARTVRAALPGATLVRDPSVGSTVVVVLGRDFSGVQKVTVAGQSGSGSKIETSTAADNPCKSS
jgi:hypothetical protein